MSTSRKVELIDRILTLEENLELKVAASPIKIYGLTPTGIFQAVKNNWVLFALWSILIYIIGLFAGPIIQNGVSLIITRKL